MFTTDIHICSMASLRALHGLAIVAGMSRLRRQSARLGRRGMQMVGPGQQRVVYAVPYLESPLQSPTCIYLLPVLLLETFTIIL